MKHIECFRYTRCNISIAFFVSVGLKVNSQQYFKPKPENIKKCIKIAKEKLQDFNKIIRTALLKGDMICGVAGKINGDLFAKVTGTIINNKRYYGIWEKDLLEGKWHLLHFGVKEDVEPEWKDYTDFWTQHGDRISPMAA